VSGNAQKPKNILALSEKFEISRNSPSVFRLPCFCRIKSSSRLKHPGQAAGWCLSYSSCITSFCCGFVVQQIDNKTK